MPSSGTTAAGTYTCSAWIPGEMPAGTLYVNELWLTDVKGDIRRYSTADLRGGGFPTEITVTR